MTKRIDFIFGCIVTVCLIAPIYWFNRDPVPQKAAEDVQALEVQRISTTDPLTNLAGCMANHAAMPAKIVFANWIYSVEENKALDSESIESFNTVRQLLLDKCTDYWSAIKTAGGEVREMPLNTAMYVVLKADPEIREYLAQRQMAKQLVRDIYVK